MMDIIKTIIIPWLLIKPAKFCSGLYKPVLLIKVNIGIQLRKIHSATYLDLQQKLPVRPLVFHTCYHLQYICMYLLESLQMALVPPVD